ncbi:putative metal ion transporter C17A12.14 [Cyphellophora attinorum]|uniref:Putative metal ion transporter C17A12.14 n=1 Tax=Cyphellophora attinorum TaxID=1664694 RepID=A0A0N0NHE0_9EURO|nr:putative metal ion transporter C17A12.14 [Phialophora attinorum]KPI34581.1 putative metal ion transporter C17A12.14 [Phialophora attinorum]
MHPLPPPQRGGSAAQANDQQRPPAAPTQTQSTPEVPQSENTTSQHKNRRRHRGGKKKKAKARRQSFIAPSDIGSADYHDESGGENRNRNTGIDHAIMEASGAGDRDGVRRRDFYQRKRTYSNDSLDSETLFNDHREQPSMRPRRDSRLLPGMFSSGLSKSVGGNGFKSPGFAKNATSPGIRPQSRGNGGREDFAGIDENDDANDRTPLISGHQQHRISDNAPNYGLYKKDSHSSSASSRTRTIKRRGTDKTGTSFPSQPEYDVNNPPSRPASPAYDDPADVMVGTDNFLPRSLESRRTQGMGSRDALIDIDEDLLDDNEPNSAPPSPRLRPEGIQRHRSHQRPGEEDVCFPEELSDMAEEDLHPTVSNLSRPRRHRRRAWPKLWVLDEWSYHEKEMRDGERRTKKVNEPVLVNGRLRPRNSMWRREVEEAPYRYTYFNEEFESTIHAQTISELVQEGGSFRELFIPDPPEIIESSESSESEEEQPPPQAASRAMSPNADSTSGVPLSTLNSRLDGLVKPSGSREGSGKASRVSGEATPQQQSQTPEPKQKKYGPRPTFWLDMRVLCKTFGIHALTSEDIMMQEAREKVELFRNYYFINYRTFEQDPNSEDYLEPVNMYVCVFRHGIITFHFNQTPHPANVRRRIRQLTDYLILSADWISYAIIDDITDVYQPLITGIEEEVDDIDEIILNALSSTNELAGESDNFAPAVGTGKEKKADPNKPWSEKDEAPPPTSPSGITVLRRIGECRKKTTSLYRLLGQKADVIKGFAKRCNEQWEVAPRSEIGLYLGDIQDHIITMSANLAHYETSLSRAHSNYLAQVNIRMGERQESTADILGKLTVIGTIVLPMNVICGMWGMNVMVPGQEVENLYWFWGITAFMGCFAICCYLWCKKVYKIV